MLEDALTNKQIAEKLGVSEETARTHVRHILTKLHLKSRSKLVKS
jgi:DNA-binding NarL/FixJ family response regulator